MKHPKFCENSGGREMSIPVMSEGSNPDRPIEGRITSQIVLKKCFQNVHCLHSANAQQVRHNEAVFMFSSSVNLSSRHAFCNGH